MKKIALIIIYFCALNTNAFITPSIVGETFDSNGCRDSVNLQFEITTYTSTNPSTYKIIVTSDSGNTNKSIELINVNSNGFYNTGYININERTNFYLLENRKFNFAGLIPYFVPIPYLSTQIKILHCENDIDSDGILNDIDECPSRFGNSRNYGCPGTPDLAIDEKNSIQINDCSQCKSSIERAAQLKPPYKPIVYRFGGNITMKPLIIKNIGDGDVIQPLGGMKLRFYLSKDDKLSSDDLGFGNRTRPIGTSLKVGESISLPVSIEGSDIGKKRSYGDYYIIIVIDEENELGTELNRENNISVIPITYTGTLPTISKLSVKIQNTTGLTLLNTKIESENEAKLLFQKLNLKQGLYFLKIYDNNNLVLSKKIYKNTSIKPIQGLKLPSYK